MLTLIAWSRHSGHFVAIVLIAVLSVETGCNHAHSGQQPASSRVDAERLLTIDLGVVSSELEGYRCISFDELGLEDSSIIRETRSSCECVIPRIVSYVSASGRSKPAIFLRLKPDSPLSPSSNPERSTDRRAANLSVLVDLLLESGEQRSLCLNLIHTRIQDGVAE
jgi:hypothetical protein